MLGSTHAYGRVLLGFGIQRGMNTHKKRNTHSSTSALTLFDIQQNHRQFGPIPEGSPGRPSFGYTTDTPCQTNLENWLCHSCKSYLQLDKSQKTPKKLMHLTITQNPKLTLLSGPAKNTNLLFESKKSGATKGCIEDPGSRERSRP